MYTTWFLVFMGMRPHSQYFPFVLFLKQLCCLCVCVCVCVRERERERECESAHTHTHTHTHSVSKTEREKKRENEREGQPQGLFASGEYVKVQQIPVGCYCDSHCSPMAVLPGHCVLTPSGYQLLGVSGCLSLLYYPHEGIVTWMLLGGFMWIQCIRKCLCFLATQDKDNHNQCHWMCIQTHSVWSK